jgi:hypothetical protein
MTRRTFWLTKNLQRVSSYRVNSKRTNWLRIMGDRRSISIAAQEVGLKIRSYRSMMMKRKRKRSRGRGFSVSRGLKGIIRFKKRKLRIIRFQLIS